MNRTIQQEALESEGFVIITKDSTYTEEELKKHSRLIAAALADRGLDKGGMLVFAGEKLSEDVAGEAVST